MDAYKTVDEYMAQFSPEVREKLEALRRTIKESAPDATEKIGYQMPAFDFHGPLVYFAAFKKHIGFFPTPSGIEAFIGELSEYRVSKGTVQFPLDKPLPLDLVARMVRYRVDENTRRTEEKKKRK